jgi:hypothetical protein
MRELGIVLRQTYKSNVYINDMIFMVITNKINQEIVFSYACKKYAYSKLIYELRVNHKIIQFLT